MRCPFCIIKQRDYHQGNGFAVIIPKDGMDHDSVRVLCKTCGAEWSSVDGSVSYVWARLNVKVRSAM